MGKIKELRDCAMILQRGYSYASKLIAVWSVPPSTTGRVLFAEDQKPSAKAQKPSAKALLRAALGKGLSGNF